jgi:CBS domain containing-hemolysin-like protein
MEILIILFNHLNGVFSMSEIALILLENRLENSRQKETKC